MQLATNIELQGVEELRQQPARPCTGSNPVRECVGADECRSLTRRRDNHGSFPRLCLAHGGADSRLLANF